MAEPKPRPSPLKAKKPRGGLHGLDGPGKAAAARTAPAPAPVEPTEQFGTVLPVVLKRRMRRYVNEQDGRVRLQDVAAEALDAWLAERGF